MIVTAMIVRLSSLWKENQQNTHEKTSLPLFSVSCSIKIHPTSLAGVGDVQLGKLVLFV